MSDELWRLTSVKHHLQRRALIYNFTRDFFKEHGFLEVETPIRVPSVAPEQQIIPFESENWLLSTSPELYMKRLLAAGYDKIFQISHCFRKGERGRQHNPEFTMLEWYRIGADYRQMIHDTEELVLALAIKMEGKPVIQYRGQSIDLNLPWPRVSVRDTFIRAAGWDPIGETDLLRFDTDFVTRVVPALPRGCPTILTGYPAAIASLARLNKDEPEIAERAEVFIGGLELANAYSELNDRQEQERRFKKDIEVIQKERGQKINMPDQFIEAITNLSDCGGIALGMDRLVMLLCNAESIQEVLPFTVDTA